MGFLPGIRVGVIRNRGVRVSAAGSRRRREDNVASQITARTPTDNGLFGSDE